MKIAIYDPDPILGGLMSWGRHMQHGLRSLGHECDIVSFTASGRPRKSWGRPGMGTAWYNRELDVTGRYTRCAEVLSKYDRIVLTEPLMGLQDREADRQNWAMPRYVRVLQLANRPFTTVLQSFTYDPGEAPFAAAIVTLPSFIGAGFAHADPARVTRGNPALAKVTWAQAPHPYISRYEPDSPIPYAGVAGTTGRFAHINGFHITAYAGAYGLLPAGTTVQFKGAAAVSNRPSFTLELYESVRDKFGYEGQRSGDDVFRHHDWVLWKDGSVIRYDGAYTDAVAACSTMTTHVSVMSDKNSTGVTNYVQLESMDAGCMQVATVPHWRDSFRGHVIRALETMPSMGLCIKDEHVRSYIAEVAAVTSESLSLPEEERKAIAKHNREVLRTEHDPRVAAKVLVEVLGG